MKTPECAMEEKRSTSSLVGSRKNFHTQGKELQEYRPVPDHFTFKRGREDFTSQETYHLPHSLQVYQHLCTKGRRSRFFRLCRPHQCDRSTDTRSKCK
ncbi:hypothetical protein DPMN_083228 [Dreissena polymorpha]|uniref:Uncharacterized protein n=1 Tax=Dreissena polymorpha TaxID=45954 RepID=A0A9D4BI80_DREPO|nr:hypothetical protein DPMN_083228 [Dreissena polymorpha]